MRVQSKKKRVLLLYSTLLLSLYALIARMKKKVHRRYKIRPFLRNRQSSGQFEIFTSMKSNLEEFFGYTRMTPKVFQYLLSLIEKDIQKDPRGAPLSPELRLAVTLHFLAEGLSMTEIARNYYIGKSTTHYIIRQTCDAIWKNLMPIFLPPPTEHRFREIAEEFWRRWNIPNCIGALDGKHIVIQAPYHSGTDYFSYKKTFSLVLMATCDAYYKFVMVDIGAQGSCHDSSVFGQSTFGHSFLENKLPIPAPKILPESNIKFPFFLAADQAFPLHQNIMRPFPGQNLTNENRIFNYRISRARRTIENTFGILVQRWRVLRGPIVADIKNCEAITKACVVLHNFLQCGEEELPIEERRYCPTGFVDVERENGEIIMGRWRQTHVLRPVGRLGSNNSSRKNQRYRLLLQEYFNSPTGMLPYQEDIILRGSIPIPH